MAKSRKTKQEKIISELRNKLATVAATPASSLTPNSLYSFTQTKATSKVLSKTSNLKPLTSSYVLSDLRKTFILSTIAILGQIVLYFVITR